MASDYGYKTATHSAGSAGGTSGTVLDANASRRYGLFVNDSDTKVYLGFGAAAIVGQAIPLNANGGSYEMSIGAGNLFTGHIQAIQNAGGTKVVCIMEGV